MKITIAEKTGRVPVTVFHLDGRINLDTSPDLRQRAQQVYEKGTQNLLLDMQKVKSLTSEGLRAIHFIYKLFLGKRPEEMDAHAVLGDSVTKSTHLKILNPQENVRRVLNISGFDTFIDVLDDIDQAVESF